MDKEKTNLQVINKHIRPLQYFGVVFHIKLKVIDILCNLQI